MPVTARILLRNSTDAQAKAGTIDAQREPVRALAQRLGAAALVEYVEEGVSGTTAFGARDVLQRLIADSQPGDFLCAFDLSRLTRAHWKERDQIMRALDDKGMRIVTVEDGEVDLESLGGYITATVRAAIAADERKKILARTAAGKANAAATGRKPQGRTPFGLRYDAATRAWSVDDTAAEIVRGIYAAIVAGETCAGIAKRLQATGTRAPRSRWGSSGVWRIATSPTYRGEWAFNGRTIAVPAVVDGATWQATQAQLLAAGRRGLKRTQHVYLLDDGTGRCDVCGGPLQIRWGSRTGQRAYYVCPRRSCGIAWRRCDHTDATVWRRIVAALRQPDLVERAVRGATEADADARTGEADAAGFERQIDRLGTVEAAILARFRRGLVTEDALDRELATIGREREMLQRSADAAREAARLARAGAAEVAGLRQAMTQIADQLDAAGDVERREIVRLLRPEIRVPCAGELTVTFMLAAPSTVAAPVVALVSASCSCTGNHCETNKPLQIAVVA